MTDGMVLLNRHAGEDGMLSSAWTLTGVIGGEGEADDAAK